MENHNQNIVEIDGVTLTSEKVAEIARNDLLVELTDKAKENVNLAYTAMKQISKIRTVYGQGTGVGANKEITIDGNDTQHGLRILRSHSAGAGPEVPRDIAKAMLIVRLNQLAVGGSGVNPEILDKLEEAINEGKTPPINKYGAIGTGDLTALATTALCIIGEKRWKGGSLQPQKMENSDALAFISSNAATLGEAALASHDINQRLRAAITVAALSYIALSGSAEAYFRDVHEQKPHEGQFEVAYQMRALLGRDIVRPARKIQDSYGLRTFPQVHGPALDAADSLEQIVQIEINSASENPLVDPHTNEIYHNGNFHSQYLALALDHLRLSLYGTAVLSAARLSAQMEPYNTTLSPYLAKGPKGSSGVQMLEYAANSALGRLHHLAMPDSINNAVISRGTEEHASFATQSAWHTTESVSPYETVLACELAAAVRSLRQQKVELSDSPLRESYDIAAESLDPDMVDRPLDEDIVVASEIIRKL